MLTDNDSWSAAVTIEQLVLTDNDSWSAAVTIEQLLRSVGRDPEELMADSATFSWCSPTMTPGAQVTIEQLLRSTGRIRKS
ncbi:hypothetical protein ACFQZE_23675 [Paenibacillus sp. GCM10027627]|uniref:hypothetical protein n=1 Tax=unclassified Paenibacillus TaxID=185978 RepID=UPI0036416725